MTDYTKAITNGTMMIRDTGGTVEFWFKTGSSTFNHQQGWGFAVGGGGFNSGVKDMVSGGAWQLFGSTYIGPGANVNVLFRINGSGLGWPTSDFNQVIPRATVPPAPSWYDVHPTSSSSIYAQFAGNGDGGAAISAWQIGYGTDPGYPQYFTDTYAADIGGLSNAYTWYFWGRGLNAVGWGPWSARASAIPFRVPDSPTVVSLSSLTNVSVAGTFTGNWEGGTPVREWQIAYGTDPTTPTNSVTYTQVNQPITGLTPGTTYYFWSRGRNDVGWGAYGPRSSIKTEDVPEAPSSVALTAPTQTSLNFSFTANGDNGKPITGYQIGYSKTAAGPDTFVDVSLTGALIGLEAGTLYYVWARARNTYGWSPLSVVRTLRTIAGAWVDDNGVWKEAVPFVKVSGEWKLARAWSKIAGVWKETT